MTRRAAGAAAAMLLLAGCAPLPESYPVPEQRAASDGPEPEPLGAMVEFADPRSPDYVVEGVLEGEPEQTWRWTNERFTVRVRVSRTEGLRLRMGFALPEESHNGLLPVTVKYFVNDRLLEAVTHRKAGQLEYRKAVPGEWLKAGEDNLLRCEVSPYYIANADGMRLGMIVSEFGLERDE